MSCFVVCSSEPRHYADQDSGSDRGHDRASVQPQMVAVDDFRDRLQPACSAGTLARGQLVAPGTTDTVDDGNLYGFVVSIEVVLPFAGVACTRRPRVCLCGNRANPWKHVALADGAVRFCLFAERKCIEWSEISRWDFVLNPRCACVALEPCVCRRGGVQALL